MDVNEVLPLEGWMTFPEVAKLLGVTNQAVHKMVFEGDHFPGVRSVGEKPLYVVPRAEVAALEQKRIEASKSPSTPSEVTLVGPDEVLARSLT